MKPRIVALSGYARSGKDTVGRILVERGWQRRAFADPLREAVYRLDPTVPVAGTQQSIARLVDEHGWEVVKDEVPAARRLLQRMGTEVGRAMFGEDFWIDLAFRGIPDGAWVVFTDCRFPNEADAAKAAGGQVWRIVRPGHDATNAHTSETALDHYPFDRTIVNDGTLDDLRAAL